MITDKQPLLNPIIKFTTACEDDLPLIIQLQTANLKENLTPKEVKTQGYVTVVHQLDLLREMNEPYPHIIAKDGDRLAGYALVMRLQMRNRIPILVDMIEEIDQAEYQGGVMRGRNYVIVGQVCIAKKYRGKGVFRGLYDHYKRVMAPYYDYIVTGIATSNIRSMRAHEKVGFEVLSIFEDSDGEWANVIWDVRNL